SRRRTSAGSPAACTDGCPHSGNAAQSGLRSKCLDQQRASSRAFSISALRRFHFNTRAVAVNSSIRECRWHRLSGCEQRYKAQTSAAQVYKAQGGSGCRVLMKAPYGFGKPSDYHKILPFLAGLFLLLYWLPLGHGLPPLGIGIGD